MRNLLYFIEVSGCISIFYCLYVVCFKNTTFFVANRIYLLTGLILSFIIPSVDLSFVPLDYHVLPTSLVTEAQSTSPETYPVAESTTIIKTDFSFLPILYWSGFIFMILRLLISTREVIRIKRRSRMTTYRASNVFITDSKQPFSFFNMIFLPKGQIDPLVYAHERAHVLRRHWIDLLTVELATSFLWFNPLMILYRRSVKTQHEYEADAFAVEKSSSLEAYLYCILNHLQAEHSSAPISQFFNLNVKQRIIMMTKNKTPNKFSMLYLLFVPVVAVLLLAFSNRSISTVYLPTSANNSDIVIIVDPGHGGEDLGAKDAEGISEKELTLAMAQRIQKVGAARNIKVILTRTGDESLSLADRVSVTKAHKADLFISLHANFDWHNTSNMGMEVVISEKNIKFEESKVWSDNLMNELRGLNGVTMNAQKISDFYVLSNNPIPAVLIELGYLSNNKDNVYLTDEKNQEVISQRIIGAITRSTK